MMHKRSVTREQVHFQASSIDQMKQGGAESQKAQPKQTKIKNILKKRKTWLPKEDEDLLDDDSPSNPAKKSQSKEAAGDWTPPPDSSRQGFRG